MLKFRDVVYELLNAETGDGEDLASVQTIRKDPTLNVSAGDLPLILVTNATETPVGASTKGYKVFKGRVHIFCAVQWKTRDQDYLTAESAASDWARKVENILLANPKLVSDTYPNGFTAMQEKTKFGEKVLGPDVISGVHASVARLPFEAEYIIRENTIYLE